MKKLIILSLCIALLLFYGCKTRKAITITGTTSTGTIILIGN